MSVTGKKVVAEPSENLIPKVPNLLWYVVLLVVPLVATALCGTAGSNSSGAVQDAWFVGLLAMLLAFVVGFFVFFAKVTSVRGRVAAASYRIGESLLREYGVAAVYPKALILHDKAKPRLNPNEIPATDAYGRQLLITITTDASGNRVVPTVHAVDGFPA